MQMGSKQKGVATISKIVEDLINEEKKEIMLEKELTQVV